jgi:Phytanoyl-CoA dioxygenase (PhyH)
MRITHEHEAHYREHGFAIVKNFCTDEETACAITDFDAVVPGWVDYVRNTSSPRPQTWDRPYPGQRGMPHFPYKGTMLNKLTLHPELRRFALLNTKGEPVRCEQSHLSYKGKGSLGDEEQPMHLDYGNHTLTYPPNEPRYWQTSYIYYFTDVEDGLAPTAVCSWQHCPEKILWPALYTREDRRELYDNEVKVFVPAGSLLIYSLRTFHRGTAFERDGGRLGMFVTYGPNACKWTGIVGWSQEAPRAEFREWVERASVEERNTVGFPVPGDPYWTSETLDGVSARFAKMDMTPYREAAKGV